MSSTTDLRPVLRKLVARTDLSESDICQAFDAILSGSVAEGGIAAFLVALAMKGETPDEIRSILICMRKHATSITPRVDGPLIDNCGTGGDSIRSFNISTAAAIVASAAGAKVAKHGNRSTSGSCGSADFLEYLGLDLYCPPSKVQSCIENIGIGFLFAPSFHPSMKNVAATRRALGIRTVFNIIGPLSNPCTNISAQVIGVFEPLLLESFAQVCQGYMNEAMIFHAHDGFDELSNTCENDIIWTTKDGQSKRIRLHPKAVGMKVAKIEQMVVDSKEESIKSTLETLYGKATKERQDIVVLNAAAALVISKIARDFRDGVEMARNAIKNGKAQDKLMRLIDFCGNVDKLREAEKKFFL